MQYLREHSRDAAAGVKQAYRRAYRATGPAVFASGITAIAGFAVLALADISMLRGFALVAVVDLTVALASTVLLLPAVTLWLERDRQERGKPVEPVREPRPDALAAPPG
ncbi:MAG: MMPL family transporter [Thermoleophilia bacterium]|nr:MMPL family transporter [Thermoleophilia bacterium]